MRRTIVLVVATCVALGWACTAAAQVTEPTRVDNARYAFAYTVEAGSLVTYPENGDGFSCIHNPSGGGKGTEPDYGLLVFGSYMVTFAREDAKAAGVALPAGDEDPVLLSADDVQSNERLGEILVSAMERHQRSKAGTATVRGADGKAISVPYFTWQTTVAGKTHYALMYVVLHEGAFIQVQVEGTRSFTSKQVEWFTTKLELMQPVPPDETTPPPAK